MLGYIRWIVNLSFSDSYAEFMKTNCADSCGFCENESENSEEEGQTDDCEDNSEHAANCPDWKNIGYCDSGWL